VLFVPFVNHIGQSSTDFIIKKQLEDLIALFRHESKMIDIASLFALLPTTGGVSAAFNLLTDLDSGVQTTFGISTNALILFKPAKRFVSSSD
jgi:hypothetical protein